VSVAIQSPAPDLLPELALTEYSERLATAERDFQQLDKRDAQVAAWRALLALVGIAMGYFCYRGNLAIWWLLIPAMVFLALVLLHRRVINQRQVAKRKRAYYKTGIARLNHDWSGHGPTGARYLDQEHEYAADLDLFGVGSLFQLINGSRTQLGKDRLADWLRHAAEGSIILERQGAVERLRKEIDLREQLALLDIEGQLRQEAAAEQEVNADNAGDEFNPNQLIEWSTQPAQIISPGARASAVVITVCTMLAGLGGVLLGWGLSPALLMLIVAVFFLLAFKSKIRSTIVQLDEASRGLNALSQVLEVMQGQSFGDPFLDQIVDRVRFEGVPPSQQVARLAKYIQYLNDSIRNQFFVPIAILLCLPLHLVHAIESWRATVGRAIPMWLAAVGEYEAIMSLSRYAFERPADPFPVISSDRLVLCAKSLGHPLLNSNISVRNDLALDNEHQMLMVSGSNMSGKSTLLRTLGVNCVLAQMGAPVCAKEMTLSLFQIATAMRVNDSLQQGRSLFFAVLCRLKRVVDLTRTETVLFLLDEILQGTNSHDRKIGAEAVIRSLLEQGAIGLVTTHDLSLTAIASSLPNIENVHFADQIKDGAMTFDYRLRPGTVEKSNAIELMRLVGLEV